MIQSDLIKLAQQGDPGAIAQLLNRHLQPRGVTAKVVIRDRCLKILLSSSRPLAQQAFVQFIQRQMGLWQVPSIRLVRVYGQHLEDDTPTWSQEFIPPWSTPADLPVRSRPNLLSFKFLRLLNRRKVRRIEPSRSSLSASGLPVEEGSGDRESQSALAALLPVERSLESIDESLDEGRPALPPTSLKSRFRGFWSRLRSLRLRSVLPYQEVFQAELFQNPSVRLLLFFVLFPLVINLFAEQVSLTQTSWLIGIYYASIWGVVLHYLIQPPRFSWGNTLRCMLFTAFIGIPILLLFQRVPPFSALYAAAKAGLVERLLGSVFGVGLLEEICKGLPVYFLMLRRGQLSDPHSAAFYGAMSGLGFAIAEGAAYSIRYAFGLTAGNLGFGSFVAANTIRFVSLPLFHAVLAGIVGYFMGLAAINPSRQGILLAVGVAIAATLHGFYNTFAGGIPGPMIIGFSILLFFTYLRRTQQMVEEMERSERDSEE
ncbi:MAG: PrsW family glutamic-type intramembrane protease [Oculatellaceae cyanobacterium Prado106]|jgi:RsiW-degrading membrane proteinase PrsW (M82 family)|nr:PrsW family glutamic-type intramembrane protease [Oculatellaceae cyanobacterium Prado106]